MFSICSSRNEPHCIKKFSGIGSHYIDRTPAQRQHMDYGSDIIAL